MQEWIASAWVQDFASNLLAKSDATAATQLIVIGEQNGVRYHLAPDALALYEKLYARYDGKQLLQDSSEY